MTDTINFRERRHARSVLRECTDDIDGGVRMRRFTPTEIAEAIRLIVNHSERMEPYYGESPAATEDAPQRSGGYLFIPPEIAGMAPVVARNFAGIPQFVVIPERIVPDWRNAYIDGYMAAVDDGAAAGGDH